MHENLINWKLTAPKKYDSCHWQVDWEGRAVVKRPKVKVLFFFPRRLLPVHDSARVAFCCCLASIQKHSELSSLHLHNNFKELGAFYALLVNEREQLQLSIDRAIVHKQL